MVWPLSINKDLKQKTVIALSLLGCLCAGAAVASIIVMLFSYAIPKNIFTNSNCDKNCSYVLTVSGFFTMLPYVFVFMWAAFTYIAVIILRIKLNGLPKHDLGYILIVMLLLGGFTSYDLNRRNELSALNYIKAVRDWQMGSVTNETIESFDNRLQKIRKTMAL